MVLEKMNVVAVNATVTYDSNRNKHQITTDIDVGKALNIIQSTYNYGIPERAPYCNLTDGIFSNSKGSAFIAWETDCVGSIKNTTVIITSKLESLDVSFEKAKELIDEGFSEAKRLSNNQYPQAKL